MATRQMDQNTNNDVIMPFAMCEEYEIKDIGVLAPRPIYSFVKRAMDIFLSLIALLITLLPVLIVALLVACTSQGGAFYCQERLGLHGKKIKVYKLRTMFADAEKNGAQWSTGDDDVRITRLGRFLRKTRFDELPQLWCVLKGEMSLVGPRPEREVFYEKFEEYIHGFHQRLLVKPGLTGLAQVSGGYRLKPEEKIVYDIQYIKTRSIWLDIKILFATVRVVLRGESAK